MNLLRRFKMNLSRRNAKVVILFQRSIRFAWLLILLQEFTRAKKLEWLLRLDKANQWCILLTTLLLHRKFPQEYGKILVLTISNPLKTQLDGIVINHLIYVSIKATYQANIDEYKIFSLIVDIADRYSRSTGASFIEVYSEIILRGIHYFGETPLLLCSATFSRLD